jgi:glycosyltransferase involved in cell wall biosynthesis
MYRQTSLCQLAYKYGSDKCPAFKKHTYTEYYFDLFEPRKDAVKKILEIGIGSGGSLLMWRDYFQNAQVYGADNQEDRLINWGRIKSILCNQSVKTDLNKLIKFTGSDIDIVIEDASHLPIDQVETCLTLMPHLSKSCVYIIEDVADKSIVEKLKMYDVEIPQIPQYHKRYDNCLVVVRHKKKSEHISIFAKMPYRVGHDRHLGRVSSIIRGIQIADATGAKLNPTEGFENDVCIYVKPPFKPGSDFNFHGAKNYIDFVDELGFCELLKKNPNVGAITLSDWNYKTLKKLLPDNEIVNIPQQHANYENKVRVRKTIESVGIIGTMAAFEYLPPDLEQKLKDNGYKFIKFSKFTTRADIIDFYLSIDVQIVWRPYYNYKKPMLANPLKIVNASSFGIPTIAYDEPAFSEMKGCYIPVSNVDELIHELNKLKKNKKTYTKYSLKCIKTAKKYHINKIAKMYKNLLK